MTESAKMSADANPYRAPGSHIDDADDGQDAILAGKGRRFGTFVVDYIGFMLFGFLFGMFVALIFGAAGVRALRSIPNLLLGVSMMFVYYAFFEGIWARTPGKLVFGTRVEDEEGGKPSIGQVMLRTVCRFIPLEAFSFFGERGWHDSISKTQVVLTRVP